MTEQQNEAIPLDLLPNKKTLFYDDLRTGLNTRDKWWALALQTQTGSTHNFLPRSINATTGDGWGWQAVWDPDLEIINFVISTTNQAETLPFILQSKNYIKFPSVGSTFGLFGGIYEARSLPSGTMTYGLQLPGNNDEFVPVSSWTIDQFQLPGNSGENSPNPSGLRLFMDAFQQPTFRFVAGKDGGVYFGFTVDGVFYPGHFIPAQNIMSSESEVELLRNLNIPARRVCSRIRNGNSVVIGQKVGFANDIGENNNAIGGIYFVATATLSLPTSATFSMKLTNVFTTGAPESVDQVPFAAERVGTQNRTLNYATVVNTDDPPVAVTKAILRVRASQYFNGDTTSNKTTWRPTRLEAQVVSDTMTDAVVFQVWLSPRTPTEGESGYIAVSPQSGLVKNTSSGQFTGAVNMGIKLATVVVGVGQRASVDIPEYFISSRVELHAGGTTHIAHDEIVVVVVPKADPSANTLVTATLFGVEEH